MSIIISISKRRKKIIPNYSKIQLRWVCFIFFNLNLEGSHKEAYHNKSKSEKESSQKKILIINLYNIFGSQRKKSLRLPYWHNLNTMVTYTIWDKVWSSSSLLCLHSFPPPLLSAIIHLMFLVTYILWFAKEIFVHFLWNILISVCRFFLFVEK